MKTLKKVFVEIAYTNGSVDHFPGFPTVRNAQDWVRDHVSLSGGRIKRVEAIDHDGSRIAFWDITWDAISQFAGLTN